MRHAGFAAALLLHLLLGAAESAAQLVEGGPPPDRQRARGHPVLQGDHACADAARLSKGDRGFHQLLRGIGTRAGSLVVVDLAQAEARREVAGEFAAAHGRPLHEVALATATGREIGETEKNLTPVLARGEELGAVLYLEEAEALFGSRDEVAEAADRYTDAEVNYLIAALREYPHPILVGSAADPETLVRWRPVLHGIVGPLAEPRGRRRDAAAVGLTLCWLER
jgi:hypothetical protein